jgi:hypothetical protein
MRSIFLAIVSTLVSLSFSNVNQINAQTQEDEAAIRQAVATMTTAFNTRDDQATASLTDERCRLRDRDGQLVEKSRRLSRVQARPVRDSPQERLNSGG